MSMKRKESSNGDHPTPDSTTKERTSFAVGDEVLMQRKDGNFYLGTIVKVDSTRELCLVKFGDNTDIWSTLGQLTKLSTGLEVMCVKCKLSQTETDNDIVMCDKCSRGYHQKCHYPEVSDEFLKEDSKWECIRCCDIPEKRLMPQRKSSVSTPPNPPSPPPSIQSTPRSPPQCNKPVPQVSKPLPQTAKPSFQGGVKSSPQVTKTPQTAKASPQTFKSTQQIPKSISQSPKPSPQPVAKPSPPIVTKPSPQPVAKSSQPAAKPSSQPAAKSSPQLVAKSSSQPAAKPSPPPAVKTISQPAAKPNAQPAAKPLPQPTVSKSSPQPVAKSSTIPTVVKPSPQPAVTKPSLQPITKPSSQPAAKPSPQSVAKSSPQSAAKSSPQPAAKSSLQPAPKPSPQPTSKPSAQPADKPSPQPATKPSPQHASKPSLQPVAKPSPQPAAKPSTQPAAKPSPQPAAKPSLQSATKSSPQPAAKPSSQPAAKPSSQPAAKRSPSPGKSPPQPTKPSTPQMSKPLSQASKTPPSKPVGQSKAQQQAKPQVKSFPPQTLLQPSDSQPKSSSTPPTPPATPTESVCSALPMATEAQKKKLPYNLNDLHWDMQHRSNTENKYCYCGGPGKWFLKMLQCTRCRQWFHGRCLASLRYPLYYGDRFYVFLCTLCNSGKEFLRRLEVKWVDLVHLATFNLTLKTAKKYVDVDDEILRFINSSWNELQLPPKILETTSDSEKREIVLSVLTSNRNRFKASREVKSRKTKWGLRVRVPPPTPVFSLPPNKPLSDQVLSDAWNNSARLKFLPPPPRNSMPSKPEDDFDLSNLNEELPGVEILHIETRLLVLPKGVPASGHNVCIKSSTPMYPESRAIKRRIIEQGMENDRVRRSRKVRRLLRSSLSKEREEGDDKERQELPPTPPSSESNPEAAPSAQPDTSGDETSSRGTLDSIIPPPANFTGTNNPFLPLPLHPVLRPVKRKLSEKDIIVTSTGEVKRRRIRRTRLLGPRGGTETGGRGKLKRLKSGANPTAPPTTSPVKSSPIPSAEELKSSVNRYFGAVNRINAGENFVVMAKRVGLDGRTQYLINWGTPT